MPIRPRCIRPRCRVQLGPRTSRFGKSDKPCHVHAPSSLGSVYGTDGLLVVDASIVPIVCSAPHQHHHNHDGGAHRAASFRDSARRRQRQGDDVMPLIPIDDDEVARARAL
jgi:hypothetical protein